MGVPVLVADDEQITRHIVQRHLENAGYAVRAACDGREAMNRMSSDLAVALLDLRMPGASGLECLEYSRQHYPDLQVILFSAVGEIEDAVTALKRGAVSYLTKPISPERLVGDVQEAVRGHAVARDHRSVGPAKNGKRCHELLMTDEFIGQSPPIRMLLDRIKRIVDLDASVLITGASGTGKTTIAQMIHRASRRANGPFVAVNCSSLPRDLVEAELFGHTVGAFTGAVAERPGRAEMADGGTLFLDEIGDLPLDLQPKLLSFLQDHAFQQIGSNQMHQVDVRVIAATHRDLPTMCHQKRFREDLFYRLKVLSLRVPSLEERREDIPGLVNIVLERIARRRGVEPFILPRETLAALTDHDWRGNVRELENVLEQATAFCETRTITLADLNLGDEFSASLVSPRPSPSTAAFDGLTLSEIEQQAVASAIATSHGNKAKAARQLGVSEKTIYNMIRRYGLSRAAGNDAPGGRTEQDSAESGLRDPRE